MWREAAAMSLVPVVADALHVLLLLDVDGAEEADAWAACAGYSTACVRAVAAALPLSFTRSRHTTSHGEQRQTFRCRGRLCRRSAALRHRGWRSYACRQREHVEVPPDDVERRCGVTSLCVQRPSAPERLLDIMEHRTAGWHSRVE